MYAVVRLKGRENVRSDMNETMRLLHLTRINHCAILPENESFNGMVKKVKDFVTWGQVDAETLASMIKKRGRLPGDKRLTDEWLKEKGFKSWEDLAKALIEGKTTLNELELKPLFRLTPASKGLKTTKKTYPYGDMGNRGNEINQFLKRMI